MIVITVTNLETGEVFKYVTADQKSALELKLAFLQQENWQVDE